MKPLPLTLALLLACTPSALAGPPPATGLRVRVSFPASARAEAVTGRVYVALNRADAPPSGRGGGIGPIQQAGPTGAPLFGLNVENMRPASVVEIDGAVFGHPVVSLNDIPKGEYLVQAFVNVYTKFERADGHTVWLHMDQWEGQNWRRSPGNLFSTPKKIAIDPQSKDPKALRHRPGMRPGDPADAGTDRHGVREADQVQERASCRSGGASPSTWGRPSSCRRTTTGTRT